MKPSNHRHLWSSGEAFFILFIYFLLMISRIFLNLFSRRQVELVFRSFTSLLWPEDELLTTDTVKHL